MRGSRRGLSGLCLFVSMAACVDDISTVRPAHTRGVDARAVGDVYRRLAPGPPSLDPLVVMHASAPNGAQPQRLRALLQLQRPNEVIDLVKAAARVDYETEVALSAAYLALSSESNAAENAAHAANAALRAIGVSPTRPEAWFNRAVAVERLGLALSWQPWREYRQQDADALWIAEASRRHIATPADWWAGFASRVLVDASIDTATVRAAVRLHGDRVRALIEDQLVPAWASAIVAGDAIRAAANVAQSSRLAAILHQETGDPFMAIYVDEVTTVSGDPDRAAGIIAAAQARQALGRGDIARSMHLLAGSEPSLAGCETAISLHQLSRGTAAYYRGEYAAATDILTALVQRAESHAWVGLAGRAAFALAAVAVRAANPGAADLNYRRAEGWLSSAGETGLLASAHAIHARQLHGQGDDIAAWEQLRGALVSLPAISGATERYAIFNAALRMALDARLEHLAAEFATALDADARRSESPAIAGNAAAQRAILLAATGQPEAAERALEDARATALTVDDADVRAALVGLIDRAAADVLATAHPCEAVDAYKRALQSLSTRLGQYHAQMYLALGAVQERCGAPDAAAGSYGRGIEALEALLRTQSREALRMSHRDRLWDLYGHLARVQAATLGRPDAALRTTLRGRQMAWYDGRSLPPPPSVGPDLRRPNQTLLTFLVMSDETFVWLTTKDGAEFVRARAGRARLEALVDRWRRAVDAGGNDRDPSKELFDLLLGGIAERLDTSDVLLVQPDGPLHGLSFAALWTGERYLIETRPVWTVAGARPPGVRAFESEGADLRVVAVGDPAFSSDTHPRLARLPGAALEARQVANLYPASSVIVGKDATAVALVEELKTADVVHIATHAVANLLVPDQSRLVLAAPGGDLSVAEIRGLRRMRARVFVLSACRSASGRVVRGTGSLSVTHAVTERLAPAAIGMQWDVGDDDSVVVATAIHRRLAAGMGVAHALQAAQLELLRNVALNLRLPRVWAAAAGVGAPFVALSSGAPPSEGGYRWRH